MPILKRRNDGCCYIHHSYREQPSTWQVDAAGVDHLSLHGVRVGDHFPTALFMTLVLAGRAWHGNHPPVAVPFVQTMDVALEADVRRFHTAIFTGALGDAWSFVLEGVGTTYDQFIDQAARLANKSWTVPPVAAALEIPEDRREALLEADRLAEVPVHVGGVGNQRYWFRRDGRWRVLWSG